LKLQQITKSNNYILEHCVDKLARINNSDYALGFLVGNESSADFINTESAVVIAPDQLFEPIKKKLTEDITDYYLNIPCSPKASFYSKQDGTVDNQLLTNKYIDNLRYIPIGEENNVYAIIMLVNVEFSVRSRELIDVTPFLLATITLLKNKKQQNRALSAKGVAGVTHQSKNKIKNPLESVLKNTFHPSFIFDDEFKVLKSNSAAQRLFNSNIERGWLAIDKVINKTMPSIAFRLLTTISKYSFLGHLDKEQWTNVPLVLENNQSVVVDLHLFDFMHLGDKCFGLMINEKTEINLNQDVYNASLQRFNALTSVVPMAILQMDKDFNCSYVNKTWSKYTGQTELQAYNLGWLACIKTLNIDDILAKMIHSISHANDFKSDLELITTKGNQLWVSINVAGLFNDRFEVTGLIITMSDISAERHHAEKLQKMANYDHLTGLSNRGFFTDRLTLALTRTPRHGITALMFLDLDRFKNINDTLGHHIGDTVIQEVAHRLKGVVRDEDSIARLGGDEFAIIFTDITTEKVIATIATKILSAINLPFFIDAREMNLSCSIGVSIANENITSPSDILRTADLALYKAKDGGRNQFCLYDESLEQDLSILNYLNIDLNLPNKPNFSFVFQPLVNANTQNLIGFEVLARWNNSEIGAIGPDIFIKTMEENGLIQDFSEWLFYSVILQIRVWLKKELLMYPQKIAINLSAKQLHLTEFADSIIALFKKEKIDPSWITLEVTETAFIQDPAIAGQNLRELKEAGFLIALDDFGTGYSSLGLLRQMPLNYIKIDRSFVKDIMHDSEAEKIVLAIIGLGKMLDLGLIAEGVEDAETKEWLIVQGCTRQQGYYFHKPLPEKIASELLKAHKKLELLPE